VPPNGCSATACGGTAIGAQGLGHVEQRRLGAAADAMAHREQQVARGQHAEHATGLVDHGQTSHLMARHDAHRVAQVVMRFDRVHVLVHHLAGREVVGAAMVT
jgi:hypothetical protein